MESNNALLQAPDDRRFQVSCKADPTGILATSAKAVVVTVGQRVRGENQEEMWDSVSIAAEEHANGDLTIKVLVFNPDWDEPRQVACIRSHPHDVSCIAPVSCHLDHVTP